MKKTYHTISIIGSQSSGKSTLLNAVFGTSFEELNRKKRVGQTTKGIWYSMDKKTNMMIIDVEGSDSNEREERTVLNQLSIENRKKEFIVCPSSFPYSIDKFMDPTDWSLQGVPNGNPRDHP